MVEPRRLLDAILAEIVPRNQPYPHRAMCMAVALMRRYGARTAARVTGISESAIRQWKADQDVAEYIVAHRTLLETGLVTRDQPRRVGDKAMSEVL